MSPSTWAIWASTPGSVGDLEVQVEGGGDVGDERQLLAGLVDRRLAGEDRDDVAEHGRGGLRRPPAPGPDIVTSVIAGASTMTALNGPPTGASGWPL